MNIPRATSTRYFEDIVPGDKIDAVRYGPLTLLDTVRWAGIQENPERVHWDREFAREHAKLPTFIASGSYRQALLARTLTDWIGPLGKLRKLKLRHTAPTHEGDMMFFSAVVSGKSATSAVPWIECDVEGHNQDNKPIMTGSCIIVLPLRG
jgi:acyl dehydratase